MVLSNTSQHRPVVVEGLFSSSSLGGGRGDNKPNKAKAKFFTTLEFKVRNPSLLPDIDPNRPTFDVRDPSNPDLVVGVVTAMDAKDARAAIDRSNYALPAWRDGTTAQQRSKLLLEWSRLIGDNVDDIAEIMTRECGKPLAESRGEIAYARSFLDYYAAEAVRPTGAGGGFLIPTPFTQPDGSGVPRGQMMAVQQAVGVTASITPWNFPIAMITRKVGPALAAGCTAIVKPAELTPLTAVALQHLAVQAGIPPDVFQGTFSVCAAAVKYVWFCFKETLRV